MKYLLFITIILFALKGYTNSAFVYNNVSDTVDSKVDTLNTEPDTTILNFKHKKIIVINYNDRNSNGELSKSDSLKYSESFANESHKHKRYRDKFKDHFASFDLGLNNYLNQSGSLSLGKEELYMELDDSKSYVFSANLFDFNIPICRNKIALVSGLGIKWNNYKFDDKSLMLMNDSSELYVAKDTIKEYSKNKLTSSYLIIPLMVEIHPLQYDNNKLWILFGAYGGVKLGSHVKTKTTSGDKSKNKKDFHLNVLIYGLRAQVGYGNWGLFCNYSLSTLFKKDEGPELYPFSIGLSITFSD